MNIAERFRKRAMAEKTKKRRVGGARGLSPQPVSSSSLASLRLGSEPAQRDSRTGQASFVPFGSIRLGSLGPSHWSSGMLYLRSTKLTPHWSANTALVGLPRRGRSVRNKANSPGGREVRWGKPHPTRRCPCRNKPNYEQGPESSTTGDGPAACPGPSAPNKANWPTWFQTG
jgi:hypothetical protein